MSSGGGHSWRRGGQSEASWRAGVRVDGRIGFQDDLGDQIGLELPRRRVIGQNLLRLRAHLVKRPPITLQLALGNSRATGDEENDERGRRPRSGKTWDGVTSQRGMVQE